jgi:hypothetical protein
MVPNGELAKWPTTMRLELGEFGLSSVRFLVIVLYYSG